MKRFNSISVLVLLILIILSGCTAPVVTLPETIEPMKNLRIGVMSDAGAIPFILAEEQGYFKAKGITVELQVFKSAIDRDTAIQTGNLDGAMSDMLSAIFFHQAGQEIKMISQTYGNYKMVSSADLTKDAFIALDSIQVGISSNTVIDFATEEIANGLGIEGKLQKVAIPQMPVRLEMLRAGELSAATLPEPLASIGILDGGSIIGSTEALGLYPGIFLMTVDSIETQSNEIKLMYEAYNEAVEYINTNSSAEYYDLLVDKLGFPPQVKDNFVLPIFETYQDPDQKTFSVVAKWMKDRGLVDTVYEYADLYTSPMQ